MTCGPLRKSHGDKKRLQPTSAMRRPRGKYVLWSDLRQLLCLLARWWVFHSPPYREQVIPYP
jgi:hypothetical protein